jgi:GrpB-like predicted nucleotidyltransferase (UPF0157 family)
MVGQISIVDHDDRWPELFDTLRARIAKVLGDLAIRIEHVGSTAVPRLAAKPIIDIDVLLASAADLPIAIERLASLGYEHEGDLGIRGREAFKIPPGDPPHHLYLCTSASGEFRRHVLLRDHLRANPEAAKAYQELKRALAVRFAEDRSAYTEGKSEFIEEILLRAG